MIQVAVSGTTGRMGKAIIGQLQGDSWKERLKLSGAMDHDSCGKLGEDAGIIAGMGECGVKIESDIAKAMSGANVVIDFSGPDFTMRLIDYCEKNGVAIVIGTTGFNGEQKHRISQASKVIPVLLSPNMSVGVNLLFHLTEIVTGILDDSYDIEIVEAHHRYKKDAPSGTAEKLKEIVLQAGNRTEENVNYGRHGLIGERPERQVGVHAVRGGDVVGDHTVFYFGDGERVELTHKASSRNTFASGAVRAADFLAGKSSGMYSMKDVLGI